MNKHENASRLRKSGKEKMIAIENTVHLQGKDAVYVMQTNHNKNEDHQKL